MGSVFDPVVAQGTIEQLEGGLNASAALDTAPEHSLEIGGDKPGTDIVTGDIPHQQDPPPLAEFVCNEKVPTDLVQGLVEDADPRMELFGNDDINALVKLLERLQVDLV